MSCHICDNSGWTETGPCRHCDGRGDQSDTLYLERAHGRFETWAYSDGRRVQMKHFSNIMSAYAWAKRNGYHVVSTI